MSEVEGIETNTGPTPLQAPDSPPLPPIPPRTNTPTSPVSTHTNNITEDVPSWQNDDEVSHCPLCSSKFTLFKRKHHCRKCGRVVCGDCSMTFTNYLPNTYVVSPQSQIFLESPHVPHRTCDSCSDELDMIRTALREATLNEVVSRQGLLASPPHPHPRTKSIIKTAPDTTRTIHLSDPTASMINIPISTTTSDGQTTQQSNVPALTTSVRIESNSNRNNNLDDDDEDDNLCPVCAVDLTSMQTAQREDHVNQCLHQLEFSGSPESKRNTNRMLVYTIPENTKLEQLCLNDDNECVICFEEFRIGDKVGRLECLCCFHYKCIKDWINRKGACECPVHTIHLA